MKTSARLEYHRGRFILGLLSGSNDLSQLAFILNLIRDVGSRWILVLLYVPP